MLTSLPRVDAYGAQALAQAFETAALDPQGTPLKVSESVDAALKDVHDDREALQEALQKAPVPPTVRAVDRLEDTAVRALDGLLEAWALLAGLIPEGDTAAALHNRLFAEGLGFINAAPKIEWAVVENKLATITGEALAPKLAALGALPMLAYLQQVHAEYGKVTGATQPIVVAESPQVGARREALLESMRIYVAAVIGSIQRRRPETRTQADTLLRPLLEWKSPRTEGGSGGKDGNGGGTVPPSPPDKPA